MEGTPAWLHVTSGLKILQAEGLLPSPAMPRPLLPASWAVLRCPGRSGTWVPPRLPLDPLLEAGGGLDTSQEQPSEPKPEFYPKCTQVLFRDVEVEGDRMGLVVKGPGCCVGT